MFSTSMCHCQFYKLMYVTSPYHFELHWLMLLRVLRNHAISRTATFTAMVWLLTSTAQFSRWCFFGYSYVKYYAILFILSLFFIRNNLCINKLKHFSPHTMLSPHLVKLHAFEMIVIHTSADMTLACAPLSSLHFTFTQLILNVFQQHVSLPVLQVVTCIWNDRHSINAKAGNKTTLHTHCFGG